MILDPFSLVIVPLSAEIARFSKNIQLYKKYSARDKAPVEHTVNWKGGEFSFKKKIKMPKGTEVALGWKKLKTRMSPAKK